MKVLILSTLLVVAINASSLEEQGFTFQAFKLEHGKTYVNRAEESKRLNIFIKNVRDIEEHNALYEQGKVSYKKGINKFTDMTQEEFNSMLTLSASKKPSLKTTPHLITGLEVPSSVDWRQKGQVTGVKSQGLTCGSCWAFSVTGSTEAAYYRKSGKLVALSEQQLVDCTRDINEGCKGGSLDETFPYIMEYGLQSESSYPYKGVDADCKYSASSVVTKVTNFTSIRRDEDALLDAVANVGPVSVAIDARYIKHYNSGIFEDVRCSPEKLDHGVLVVGYGTQNGKDFWIVKNSWGDSFGEEGYFRITRGNNECGIAEDDVYPTIS